ncbi:MAG: hypothetical protein PHE70_09720 [Tepidanaerobacteraceae bacterium]|nr:hypothetical protein [Tepidanaerobacteraceae bacterium]
MKRINLVDYSADDVSIRITGDVIVTLRVVAAKREEIDEIDEEFENIDEIEAKIIEDYLDSIGKQSMKNRSKKSTRLDNIVFFDSDDFLEETDDDIPW